MKIFQLILFFLILMCVVNAEPISNQVICSDTKSLEVRVGNYYQTYSGHSSGSASFEYDSNIMDWVYKSSSWGGEEKENITNCGVNTLSRSDTYSGNIISCDNGICNLNLESNYSDTRCSCKNGVCCTYGVDTCKTKNDELYFPQNPNVGTFFSPGDFCVTYVTLSGTNSVGGCGRNSNEEKETEYICDSKTVEKRTTTTWKRTEFSQNGYTCQGEETQTDLVIEKNTRDFKFSAVKWKYPEEYKEKTKSERGYEPSGYPNPFDDLEITVNVVDEYAKECKDELKLPIYTNLYARNFDTNQDLAVLVEPLELDFKERICKNPETGTQEFCDSDMSNYSYDVYVGVISGWKQGWGSNQEIMDLLIKNGLTKLVVYEKDNFDNNVSKFILLTSCLILNLVNEEAGYVLSQFGESANTSPAQRILKVSSDNIALKRRSPFREYNNLSFVIDLLPVADKEYKLEKSITYGGKSTYYFDYSIQENLSHNFCENIPEYSDLNRRNIKTFYHGNEIVHGGYSNGVDLSVLNISEDALTFVHEFGHTFGDLEDEYWYSLDENTKTNHLNAVLQAKSKSGKNCMSEPNWFNVDGSNKNVYGDYKPICALNYYNFRPSAQSIMRIHYMPNNYFNVVSCGYILIKFGVCSEKNMLDCWEKCMNPSWNTIKPGKSFCGVYDFDPITQKCCSVLNEGNYGDFAPAEGCCGKYGEQIPYNPSTNRCCIGDNGSAFLIERERTC